MRVYSSSDHITGLTSPNLVPSDLISSELIGCEAIQLAVVSTSQNAEGRTAHVKADSEYPVTDRCSSCSITVMPIVVPRGFYYGTNKEK